MKQSLAFLLGFGKSMFILFNVVNVLEYLLISHECYCLVYNFNSLNYLEKCQLGALV